MLVKISRVVLLTVMLVVSLAACGPGGISGQATPTPLPQVVNVEKATYPVELGAIVSEKELQGEIVPQKQDELFFRASGAISRVVVKPGDTVKKGDILAEMQVDDLLNQLQQVQIDLEVAQANLAKDKVQREYDIARANAEVFRLEQQIKLDELDLQNSSGMYRERAEVQLSITKKNLELAKQNLDLISQTTDTYMEQAVKRNELAVQRVQGLLAERQIIAPYDCIVLRSGIRPGQQVDAFFSAFVVGDPSELIVRSPYDFDLVKDLNQESEVRVEFFRDDEGKASAYLPSFAPVSLTDQTQVKNSTTLAAQFFYFDLPQDADPKDVVVGKQVTVVVVLGRKDGALLLPPAAIREYRGFYFVIVQDGDRRRRVEVNKIGLKSPDKWEVYADLKPGDIVLGP